MPNYSLFDEIPQQMPMQPMPQMIQQFGAGTGLSDADRRMFMNQPSQMIQQFGSGSGLSDMDRQRMQQQQVPQQRMQQQPRMIPNGLFGGILGSGSGLSDMDRHQMMIFQHQMMQREDLMRKLGLFDHLGDSINAPD